MNSIQAVKLVSDGVVIDFEDGTTCYFPASFLLDQRGQGSNQIFLTYDPSGYEGRLAAEYSSAAQIVTQ